MRGGPRRIPAATLAPGADRIARASRSTSTAASKQDTRSACSRAARPHPQNFREGRNATRAQPDENRAGHRPEIYFRLAERFAAAGTRIDRLAKTLRVHITRNWRGKPLVSHEVIINLIASTATKTGLKIRAALDRGSYPTGVAIDEEQLAAVNLKRADFHGD
jgi:Rhodopirellula transposase DDE domain